MGVLNALFFASLASNQLYVCKPSEAGKGRRMDAFGKQQNGCQLDVHPLMCCGGNKELTYEYRMKLGSISFAICESMTFFRWGKSGLYSWLF